MVGRIMSANRIAVYVALGIVVNMAVTVAVMVPVRSDFRCYRESGRVSRGTMGQGDDERCNDQCKRSHQREEVARCIPSSAIVRYLAHAPPFLKVVISP